MICPRCQHNQDDGIPTCQNCNFAIQVYFQQVAQSNQFNQQAQPNQFNQQAQSNQFNQQAQPNQFNQQAQPNQYNQQAQPNQYNQQAQPNQYNQQAQPNQYNQQAQPNQFNQQAQPNQFNQQPSNQNTIDSIMELVGSNQSYYREAFRKVENVEKSFNWCAYFFISVWAVYHKMYNLFCVIIGYYLFLSIVIGISIMAIPYVLPVGSIKSIRYSARVLANGQSESEASMIRFIVFLIGLSILIVFNYLIGKNANKILYHHLYEVVEQRNYISDIEYGVFRDKNSGVKILNVFLILFGAIFSFIYFIILGIKQLRSIKLDYDDLLFNELNHIFSKGK